MFMMTPCVIVDHIYLLRTLGSRYLSLCFSVNIPVLRLNFKYEAELWKVLEDPDLSSVQETIVSG